MTWQTRGTEAVPREVRPELRKGIHQEMLELAHLLGQRAIDRLQLVHDHFPTDVPQDLLDGLQTAFDDPPLALGRPHLNRRCAPRFLAPQGHVVIWDRRARAPVEGSVLDWSWDGMRLASPGPFEPGSILRVQHAGAREEPATLEVRYCAPLADGWILGCQRVRRP